MIIKTLGLSSFTRGVKALSVGDSKLIRSRLFLSICGLSDRARWIGKCETVEGQGKHKKGLKAFDFMDF